MKENNIITLKISDSEIQFQPNLVAYNKCLNEAARTEDIIGAMRSYLQRIVTPESREALNAVLLTPGAAGQVAAKINELYAPALEIEVKELAS